MSFRNVQVKPKNQFRELKLVSSEEGKRGKRWKLLIFFQQALQPAPQTLK